MKKAIIIHFTLSIAIGVLFFGLGSIDKNRLEQASIDYKPNLLFAHDKAIAHDGGSVHWESLMYSAHEGRRLKVWEENGKTEVTDGFQGSSWTWKYHNFVWLLLMLLASLTSCLICICAKNKN